MPRGIADADFIAGFIVPVDGVTFFGREPGKSKPFKFFLAQRLTSPNWTVTSRLLKNARAGEINRQSAFAERFPYVGAWSSKASSESAAQCSRLSSDSSHDGASTSRLQPAACGIAHGDASAAH